MAADMVNINSCEYTPSVVYISGHIEGGESIGIQKKNLVISVDPCT